MFSAQGVRIFRHSRTLLGPIVAEHDLCAIEVSVGYLDMDHRGLVRLYAGPVGNHVPLIRNPAESKCGSCG